MSSEKKERESVTGSGMIIKEISKCALVGVLQVVSLLFILSILIF